MWIRQRWIAISPAMPGSAELSWKSDSHSSAGPRSPRRIRACDTAPLAVVGRSSRGAAAAALTTRSVRPRRFSSKAWSFEQTRHVLAVRGGDRRLERLGDPIVRLVPLGGATTEVAAAGRARAPTRLSELADERVQAVAAGRAGRGRDHEPAPGERFESLCGPVAAQCLEQLGRCAS